MKLAITADTHLCDEHIERFSYFENLLVLLRDQGITDLLVAGDLFEQGYGGYLKLEKILRNFSDVTLHLVLGNHDSAVSQKQFSAENIIVYDTPSIMSFSTAQFSFLLLPYQEGVTMGQALQESGLLDELGSQRWVLVSHGDYGVNRFSDNGSEQGYFPISAQECARIRAHTLLLGHIHKPSQPAKNVYYSGSPWPISQKESGLRSVLLFDTLNGAVESLYLSFVPLYVTTQLQIIPDGEEAKQVVQAIEQELKHLFSVYPQKKHTAKIKFSLALSGASSDRGALQAVAEQACAERGVTLFSFSVDDVRFAEENSLASFAAKVRDLVEDADFSIMPNPEFRKKVFTSALQFIYPSSEKGGN